MRVQDQVAISAPRVNERRPQQSYTVSSQEKSQLAYQMYYRRFSLGDIVLIFFVK